MDAFDLLANLVQTIHSPPQTFVLLSIVAHSSWQLRLFLVAAELSCFISPKREEISRDRKIVAGDKEGAFKDWKALATFIKEKIIRGDLYVAGWGSSNVTLIIDPGRPSSISIPLTASTLPDAAAAITDVIYSIANDAREHRKCSLFPPTVLLEEPHKVPQQTPAKNRSQEKAEKSMEDKELERLKAEIADLKEALRVEQARPKVGAPKAVTAPPKVVPGDSKAKPGQKARVVKRAEFDDDDDDDDDDGPAGPAKNTGDGLGSGNRSKEDSRAKPKTVPGDARAKPGLNARVVKRAEFDGSDEEDEESVVTTKKRKKA